MPVSDYKDFDVVSLPLVAGGEEFQVIHRICGKHVGDYTSLTQLDTLMKWADEHDCIA